MKFLVISLISTICFYSNSQDLLLHLNCNINPYDISRYNNNGKIIGGVTSTVDRFGNQCGAFSFNGIDGYIEIPNSTSLEKITQKMSVTFWYKLKKNNKLNKFNWLTILCKGIGIIETPSNPQFRFQTFQSDIQSTISLNSEFTEFDTNFNNHLYEIDKWCFYSITWDGKIVQCFINTNKIWEFPYHNDLIPNKDPLHIGKDIPGSVEYFLGDLDDIRIYNEKLTVNKLKELYHDQSEAEFEDDFILKCPKDIKSYTDYDECTAKIKYLNPVVIEKCGTTTLKRVSGLYSGASFPVGVNTVKYEAINTFSFKKTCSFKVIIEEKIDIKLTCPNDTILYIDHGSSIRYDYTPPVITNKCVSTNIKLLSGINSGNYFPIGITTNKFELINERGFKSSCSFDVTVVLNKKSNFTVDTTTSNSGIPIKVFEYEKLKFKDNFLTILIYDNKTEDNDTVSIFFNKEEIIYKEMIKLRKNFPTIKFLELKSNLDNELVIKAWNNGKIPPNTLKIEFYEGYQEEDDILKEKIKPEFVKSYSSEPKKGAKIILYKK